MKHFFLFGLILIGTALTAQVEIDQAIELTGADGDRAVRNLEAPVDGTDAVNKDYVDNAVSGSGGGGGPTMVSDQSSTTMNFGEAIRYCNALDEGGHQDWYLPYSTELYQLASRGGVTVSNNASTSNLWTIGPVGERSGNNPGTVQSGVTIQLGNGSARGGVSQTELNAVRCIR
jgi:hypothetical protein